MQNALDNKTKLIKKHVINNNNLNLNLKSSIIKNYYKTIDGKEAQSLYKSPVIAKMKIKFFLNPPMIY